MSQTNNVTFENGPSGSLYAYSPLSEGIYEVVPAGSHDNTAHIGPRVPSNYKLSLS